MPRKIYTPDKDAFARTLKDQLVQEIGQNPTQEQVNEAAHRHVGTLQWLGKKRTKQIRQQVERETGMSK